MSMCTGPGYRLMLLSCFDPPDPPEESKHGINVYHSVKAVMIKLIMII